MDIEFASSRMEKDLSNRRRITKQYGHIQTSLENRLSELWAANSLGDVTTAPPPRRHKLTGDRTDCWGDQRLEELANCSATHWRV